VADLLDAAGRLSWWGDHNFLVETDDVEPGGLREAAAERGRGELDREAVGAGMVELPGGGDVTVAKEAAVGGIFDDAAETTDQLYA